MAKFGSPVLERPPFTVTLPHFMETYEERGSIEMYKDGYFRVIMAPREQWQALRDGWTEDREEGVVYKPLSSHPDNIAKAAQQQRDLAAKQEADRAAKENKGMVSRQDIQKMINAALLAQPSNPPNEFDED